MPAPRPAARSFRDLLVWRKAHEFTLAVYTFTAGFPKAETYGLALQMRRAASGITSKPAIEDHFKTGQRTITLDELVLPYRLAVWQVQFDPVRSLIVSPEMPAVIPARRSAGPYSSPPLPASGGEL